MVQGGFQSVNFSIKKDIKLEFTLALFISLVSTLIIDKLFTLDATVAILLFIIVMLLIVLLIFLDRVMVLSSRYITYLGTKEASYRKAIDIVSKANYIVVSMIKGPTFHASSKRKEFFKFIEEQISKNQKIKFIRIFYDDFLKISNVMGTNFVLQHMLNLTNFPNVETYLLDSIENNPIIMVDNKYFVTPLFEITDDLSAGLYFIDEELGEEFYRHIDDHIRGNPRIHRLSKENIINYYKCLGEKDVKDKI